MPPCTSRHDVGDAPSCTDGRAVFHRLVGIEHRRQNFVFHRDAAAAFLGRRLAVGDDGGDALADEAHDLVEHQGVVGIDGALLVPRGREGDRRRVFMRQHRMHAGHGQRLVFVDRADARVRVRRAQKFHVKQAVDRDIEREARLAGDHIGPGRRRHAVADRFAGRGILDVAHAADRVRDRAIAGAAADIALQRAAEVRPLRLVERRRGHDHAGGAEAALEALRVEEGALHRVQFAGFAETFDGRDVAALGAERRNEATVHRLAVDEHGAGAAVAGIAALLDAEPAELAQEGAQTLAGRRPRENSLPLIR